MVKDGRFRALRGLPNANRRLPPPLKDRGPKPVETLPREAACPPEKASRNMRLKGKSGLATEKGGGIGWLSRRTRALIPARIHPNNTIENLNPFRCLWHDLQQ